VTATAALLDPLDEAVVALVADGTVERLQPKWIDVHLVDLPVLR
jgi:ABC-type amino acid transport substrate-binding protein